MVCTVIKTAASIIGKILLCVAIVFVTVFVMVIIQIIIAALSGESLTDMSDLGTGIWIQYGTMVSFVVAAIAMYHWFERKKGWSLGWSQKKASLFAIHGLLAGILFMSISALLIWVIILIVGIVVVYYSYNRKNMSKEASGTPLVH